MNLGIIGGSGLYELEGLTDLESLRMDTPFGEPSDEYVHGKLGQADLYFLPRHGKGHRLLPSEINHRANIFGLKTLGVDFILSITAVGSLKEEIAPGSFVAIDQFVDRVRNSKVHTFFGQGLVAHVSMADPVCSQFHKQLHRSAGNCGEETLTLHSRGTYVNMEGPAFSTRAESMMYRQFGFDVIGMTSLAEARLSREAEICYAALAMVTDYDCWHDEEGNVSAELVMENVKATTLQAKAMVRDLAANLEPDPGCSCRSALHGAIMSDPESIPEETKKALAPLIEKYVG